MDGCFIMFVNKKEKKPSQLTIGQPVGNFLFKVNKGNTTRCEICSKSTIKTE